MMKIEVNTTTATLIPPRESLTPGAVNAVQLEFTFSDEWNGLTKTCVFSNEIEMVPAELQNDITSVPTEVLDEVYRWISVGVSGEDAEGTVIIPTIWCRIGQCIPGASGRFVTIDMLQAYWSKQEIMFELEGDGTKFLGDDGVYHYVSQGGGDVTHEELDAALALKADKDAFDALSATVDDKADKSEIITVTTGDGTKYLADDGTYKTITGGGDVTHDELDAAIAPLATKDELSTAVEPLATKTELASATAGLATTAAMNAALALKADKSELASYAKQYDVNQALATKADKTETETALAQKADKDEIITITTGAGTKFLADDGTYKTVQVDEKTFVAEYNVTTAQEIIAFLDASKEPFAPMVVKRGADYYTVTTAAKQATNKVIIRTFATLSGNFYMFTYTVTDGTWASSSYGFQQMLESGANIKTVGGQSILGSGDIPIEGGTQVQADWNEADTTSPAYIQNKPTIPDVSGFETTEHAEATYAKKDDVPVFTHTDTPDSAGSIKKDVWTINGETKQTFEFLRAAALSGECVYTTTDGTKCRLVTADEFEVWGVTKDELSTATEACWKKSDIGLETTGTGTLFLADDGTYKPAAGDPPDLSAYLKKDEAAATYATKAEIPDVTGFETTAHAEVTYATKTELADKADTATVDSALALKADKTELADYETSEHAAATYATKTELTEGLAGKVDTADIADMLTKTEAESTYADKVSLLTLENTVDAQRDRINNLDANKADKTQIITVTSGTGTLFLADDGTYKPAAGDPPDLSAYLTKTEAGTTYTTITHAEATYATKEDMTIADNELQEAIDLKADASALADYETTAHASATYATKAELPDVSDMLTKTEAGTTYATKTELADKADSATVTALSGVVTGHTASISALETGKADKSEIPVVDSTLIPGSPNPVSNDAVVTGFATYGTQIEQLNAQVVANAEAIEGLESSKADVSDIPDVSGFETTAHAEATYATKTELDAKADRTQLQGYLTRLEASETYETIARASKIKSITAAGHAVTVTDEGLANVGGTKVSRSTETPQIGVSNVSLSVQQILPATEEATTGEGGTLPITYTSTTSGALTEYSNFTIDGVPIATKDDLAAGESPIKSISAGGVDVAPDASGNVALEKAIVVGEATQVTSGTRFTMSVRETVSDARYGPEFSATFVRDTNSKTSDCQLYLIDRKAAPTLPAMDVRVVTHDEFVAQSSPIKSISYGGTVVAPDATGEVALSKSTITVETNPTSPPSKTYRLNAADGNQFRLFLTDDATGARFGFTVGSENASVEVATKTWVQQYVASLDGTNMKF